MFRPVGVSVVLLVALEVVLALAVAERIGVLPTLVFAVALSAAGAALLRRQGVAFAAEAVAEIEQRRLDRVRLADRGLGLVAGVLLTVPGFLSGAIGILLFLPPVRRLGRPLVQARAERWASRSLWFGPRFVDVVDVDEATPNPSDPGLPVLGDPRGVHR